MVVVLFMVDLVAVSLYSVVVVLVVHVPVVRGSLSHFFLSSLFDPGPRSQIPNPNGEEFA